LDQAYLHLALNLLPYLLCGKVHSLAYTMHPTLKNLKIVQIGEFLIGSNLGFFFFMVLDLVLFCQLEN
jgi:hypothetical protein